MKYIRTKDGIYEPTKWQCDLSGEMILVKADNKFGNDKVFAEEVYKEPIQIIETALKALEIMKTKLGIEKEDFFYDDVLGYMFVGNVVSKEENDLLKEVLL